MSAIYCLSAGQSFRPSITPRSRRQLRQINCSASPPQEASTADAEPAASTCKTCGVPLSEVPRGCNQEGRVAGGVGAVVGFDWWPIKAYRPCPVAAKAGVRYTRKGQITDEIMFGGRDRKR